MNYNIVHEKRDLSNLTRMLSRFHEDWKKSDVTMAIFRRSSKPMLVAGRTALQSSVPKLASGAGITFASKPDKTKTIMRVGLVNKGKGRLGHLFNFGTADRINYTTGRSTGKINRNDFGGGWWDKAVNLGRPAVESEIDKVAPQIINRFARKYKQ